MKQYYYYAQEEITSKEAHDLKDKSGLVVSGDEIDFEESEEKPEKKKKEVKK